MGAYFGAGYFAPTYFSQGYFGYESGGPATIYLSADITEANDLLQASLELGTAGILATLSQLESPDTLTASVRLGDQQDIRYYRVNGFYVDRRGRTRYYYLNTRTGQIVPPPGNNN